MKKVTFSDLAKTKLTYLTALETEEFYDNAYRRVLRLELDAAGHSLDALHQLLSEEENVKHITLEGEPDPVYKTTVVTQEVQDAEGKTGTVQQEITLLDEQGQPVVDHYVTPTNVYDDYTILMFVGVEKKQVSPETSEAPAKYADCLVAKLGKPTYRERQMAQLVKQGLLAQ